MKRSSASCTARSRGFTLIEVLIAMTLFSVILTLVFSSLYLSGKSREAGDTQIQQTEDQRLILAFIKRQLSELVPLTRLDNKGSHLLFRGETDRIDFVGALPAHRGGGALQLLSLQAGEDLILKYQTLLTDDVALPMVNDAAGIKSQILLNRIEKIEFSYYGRDKPGQPLRWSEDWLDRKTLPELISLRITPLHETHYWPTLIIPVRAQAQTGQIQFTLQNRKTAPSS